MISFWTKVLVFHVEMLLTCTNQEIWGEKKLLNIFEEC